LQKELVDCLLTRNHDGFVRQKHLERIIGSENVWIPPFLIRLVGEYVLEIFDLIDQNRGNPNVSIYPEFVRSNPVFIALTEQRVISYWNAGYCYPGLGQRAYTRDDYIGFRLIRFFKALAINGRAN